LARLTGILISMRFYPVNFLLEGKSCVVVGGGEVAARKVNGLLDAGAVVTVVSPEACEAIESLADEGKLKWKKENWRAELAREAVLIVVATDDEAVNRRAAADARKARIPVNVADRPDDCDFVLPSILRRGPITVAVGTGGASPALAAHLRRQLQEVVGHEYAMAADILGKLREILEKTGVEPAMRGRMFKDLVEAGLAEKLKDKDRSGAESLLREVVGKYVDAAELLEEEP